MKLPLKIWALAILYQTVVFACLMYQELFAIGPLLLFEFLGGLPGLLIFSLPFKSIAGSCKSIPVKWRYMATLAVFSSFLTSMMTMIVVLSLFTEPVFSLEGLLITLLSPACALLALFTFRKSILAQFILLPQINDL